MAFVLFPFAVVSDGYIVRFTDNQDDVGEGEVLLPVIADDDPVIGPDERIFGPDFEVLEDRVRAYGRAVPKEPEEILANRIQRLEQLIADLEAKVV